MPLSGLQPATYTYNSSLLWPFCSHRKVVCGLKYTPEQRTCHHCMAIIVWCWAENARDKLNCIFVARDDPTPFNWFEILVLADEVNKAIHLYWCQQTRPFGKRELDIFDMFDHLNIGKNSEQQCATIVCVWFCMYCSRLCVMYMGVIEGGGGEGLLCLWVANQKHSGLQGVIACVRRSVGFAQPSCVHQSCPSHPPCFYIINSCCRSHRGGLALWSGWMGVAITSYTVMLL